MSSRYPQTNVLDYCFNPVHVVDDDKDLFVPCGHCDGCLLHKANEWSMRVGMEIEHTPNTIFYTLTYNNKYLPKLHVVFSVPSVSVFPSQIDFSVDYDTLFLSADNDLNIRYDGSKDVLRKEKDFEVFTDKLNNHVKFHFTQRRKDFKVIQNFEFKDYTCYSSKRDFQLWLKLLRKDLENEGIVRKGTKHAFRYFGISEYGPTTFRAHIHGLIFPKNKEIAEYLIQCGLYKNWKMCDKVRFDKYTHYCDSGARGYVTQYLTQFSSLPTLYKANKEIAPFRFSSKSPAIGYVEQENEKIYQDVRSGITQYSRPISRLGIKVVLDYPKNYINTLLPKCEGYSKFSFPGLVRIYGRLWSAVRKIGLSYTDAYALLSAYCKPVDLICNVRCFDYCYLHSTSPEYYVDILVEYYYKRSMSALRMQYKIQEDFCHCLMTQSFSLDKVIFFLRSFYVNVASFIKSDLNNSDDAYYSRLFLEGFGLGDVDVNFVYDSLMSKSYVTSDVYKREVESICQDMIKVSKFNELTGNSPHIV